METWNLNTQLPPYS